MIVKNPIYDLDRKLVLAKAGFDVKGLNEYDVKLIHSCYMSTPLGRTVFQKELYDFLVGGRK